MFQLITYMPAAVPQRKPNTTGMFKMELYSATKGHLTLIKMQAWLISEAYIWPHTKFSSL